MSIRLTRYSHELAGFPKNDIGHYALVNTDGSGRSSYYAYSTVANYPPTSNFYYYNSKARMFNATSGRSCGEWYFPEEQGIYAFHYIKKLHPLESHLAKTRGEILYMTRDKEVVLEGETLYRADIKLCNYGLHASLERTDARKYYTDSRMVLTKVKVWGRVIFSEDKLVAQYRKLIKEI